MKNKFEVFNNLELEKDYEEIVLSESDKSSIKDRMNKKLRTDRLNNSKLRHKKIQKYLLAGSILIVVFGTVVINTNPSMAENIESKLEEFFGIDNEKLNEYKVSKDLVAKDNGIEINIKEAILDDRRLILDMVMDYSEFDFGEINIEYGNLCLRPPSIKIGDMVFPGQSGSSMQNDLGENQINILYEADLHMIDTDGDAIPDKECEVLSNLDSKKDYDMTIEFDGIDIISEYSETSELIEGNWKFETNINVTAIINDTKPIEVNEKINIDNELLKAKLKIEEVRVSPIYTKVKFEYEYNVAKYYDVDPLLYAVYEDGQEQAINFPYARAHDSNIIKSEGEFLTKEGIKRFKLVPAVRIKEDEVKLFYENGIDIKVP